MVKLNITEQADLERLQQQSKELENQIELLKMQAEAKGVESNKQAIKTAQKIIETKITNVIQSEGMSESSYSKYKKQYDELVKKQDELTQKQDLYNKTKDETYKISDKELAKLVELSEKIALAKKPLAELALEASDIANSIPGTDEESIKWKSTLLDIVDYVSILGKTGIQNKSEG